MTQTISVEFWPIEDLIPNPRNARTHDESQIAQIGRLAIWNKNQIPAASSAAGRFTVRRSLAATRPELALRGASR